MDSEIKLIICGTPDTIKRQQFHCSLATQFLFDPGEIKIYIAKESSTHFIILLLDPFTSTTIGTIIDDLSNQKNIIAIYIDTGSVHNQQIYGSNVVHSISRNLITNEVTFRAIRSKALASALEQKAKGLKEWTISNNTVKSCHILLIPLNTDDSNLIHCQQDFIEMCKRLYPNREIIVCTIYDYIASKESDINESTNSSCLFQNQQRQHVCEMIREIAPIRIYLLGNDRYIPNYWSRLLIAKEIDNGRINVRKYSERCTFMEYEPVVDEIKRDVRAYLGCQWQVTITYPVRRDYVENDPNFRFAIECIYDTLETREKKANVNLCQQLTNYRENSSDHSGEFHQTGQPEDMGQTDTNGDFNEDIDNMTQRD